uniref:EGF-like domain-containing protein n=1 Tax=Eptatretus burgeri TaxID=7764 RepID=A0A8C4QK71_EPTBU
MVNNNVSLICSCLTDIDECKLGTSNCRGKNEICTNTIGLTPTCRGKNEICTNTIGLYQCDCENGYDRINSSCLVNRNGPPTTDTTSQPGSSAATQVVSTTSTATGQTSGVTTVSATDTSQPGSIATTRVISTTMTTTEICDWQKCQKKCQMIPCQNGGTCSCIDAACTITCKCTSAFRGSRCEHGENIFLAQLRQDAPKVQFDMTVLFKLLDLKTSQKERMV